MHMTRVYEFTCFDLRSNGYAIVPTLATVPTIAALGGRQVKYSEQDVPTCLVDSMGFYPCPFLSFVAEHCARAHLAKLGFRAARPIVCDGNGTDTAAAKAAAVIKPVD